MQVRQWLYNWEKKGYEKATLDFQQGYSKEKGFLRYGGKFPELHMVIRGKLNYLRMIRGVHDPVCSRLKTKFDELFQSEDWYKNVDLLTVKKLLDIWHYEDGGAIKALQIYKRKLWFRVK